MNIGSSAGCPWFAMSCVLFLKVLFFMFDNVAPLVADKIESKSGCGSP